MRPVILTEPAVIVPARCAPDLARVLVPELARMRRLGVVVQPETVEAIERLEVMAAAVRNAVPQVPQPVPSLDGGGSVARESITVKTAADTLGISERAVTKRLVNGSLTGRKVRGAWEVDRQSVEAVKESP